MCNPVSSLYKLPWLLFDIFSLLLNLVDVITDILILVDWYGRGLKSFFWVSFTFMLAAQLVYGMLFLMFIPKNTSNWSLLVVLILSLPLGHLVAPLVLLQSFRIPCVVTCFEKLNFHAYPQYEPTTKEELFMRHLKSHGGFIAEAIFESLPQSILQMTAIVLYSNGHFSTLELTSLMVSILSIVSRGAFCAVSIDRWTSIFNFLCMATDVVVGFCIAGWLSFIPPGAATTTSVIRVIGDWRVAGIPSVLWIGKAAILILVWGSLPFTIFASLHKKHLGAAVCSFFFSAFLVVFVAVSCQFITFTMFPFLQAVGNDWRTTSSAEKILQFLRDAKDDNDEYDVRRKLLRKANKERMENAGRKYREGVAVKVYAYTDFVQQWSQRGDLGTLPIRVFFLFIIPVQLVLGVYNPVYLFVCLLSWKWSVLTPVVKLTSIASLAMIVFTLLSFIPALRFWLLTVEAGVDDYRGDNVYWAERLLAKHRTIAREKHIYTHATSCIVQAHDAANQDHQLGDHILQLLPSIMTMAGFHEPVWCQIHKDDNSCIDRKQRHVHVQDDNEAEGRALLARYIPSYTEGNNTTGS